MLNTWNLKEFDWTIETAGAVCYGAKPPLDEYEL